MTKLSREQIDELINAVQGTCRSLEDVCEQYFGLEPSEYENEMEILNAVDNVIFLCNGCNWWCEMGEMTNDPANDWTCTDCNPDIED